jgi:hypothetical protein
MQVVQNCTVITFMKNAPYYVPVAVRESAKLKALALVNEGYIQSRKTIECPLCSAKYLFLCDSKDSGRAKSITRKHEDAMLYFTDKVRESHQRGHIEDVLVLPYELHMISSGSKTMEAQDVHGRKAD